MLSTSAGLAVEQRPAAARRSSVPVEKFQAALRASAIRGPSGMIPDA
jgi:hypothetical protein